MDFSSVSHESWFVYGVVPLLIFLARTTDVSVGTIRIIMVNKGLKWQSAALGFVEIMVWLIAITQALKNLNHIFNYFAYAGGFAMGNIVGLYLESKLAVGKRMLRIITQRDATALIQSLKSLGVGVTAVDAQGSTGKVQMIYSIIERKDYPKVVDLIQQFNPKAFYSVEDVRLANEGVFPLHGK